MTDALLSMPKYETYKDSGVQWLEEIPSHWETIKLKYEANVVLGKMLCNEKNGNYQLRAYLKSKNIQWLNVDVSSVDEMWFSVPELELYRLKCGDLVLSEGGEAGKTCIWNDELDECYIQNSAHKVTFLNNNYSRYFLYQFFVVGVAGQFNSIVNQVSIAHLTKEKLVNIELLFPREIEQTAIAKFLDRKTTQIDQAIAIKEKQIALLKERQQILIQNAVTRGLDPNVPMKDSGVEWIEEIPEHWECKRLKYVLEERNERSEAGEEPLFMVSQVHGLVVRSEFHDKAEVAASNVDNKIVYENDLVFNKLKAHLGVFFKSNIDFEGLVSPDYAVYKKKSYIEDLKLLEVLFRHPSYITQFIIRATGIVEGLIRLYTDELFDISVGLPPKEEQYEILNYIALATDRFDKVIVLQQLQIQKLKEYKSTLINSAVTGKIKVPSLREPGDG